jgi:transcription antitermination factor NusG
MGRASIAEFYAGRLKVGNPTAPDLTAPRRDPPHHVMIWKQHRAGIEVVDNRLHPAPLSAFTDARAPPLGLVVPCAGISRPGETRSVIDPWVVEGISRATWYRRSRPEPEPEQTEPTDVERWYVVRTMHGQTDLADDEIRQAGFEVVTARICRPATPARRSASGSLIRATEERYDPLFIRYVIVRLNLAAPDWKRIPAMESVERIISDGHLSNNGIGVPIAVRDSAIERLRKILSPAGIYFPPGYRAAYVVGDPIDVGTALHVQDGLLAEYAGICAQSDGKRVEMLMGWFGRDNVPTHVRQSAVQAI